MPAKQLKNVFVNPTNKLNYSRSLFKWEDCHSTNMLTGYIVPVQYIPLMPGDTVPNKFGFVLQSAPLLGPSLDNCYIDIISVFCPTRLVMANFNEWLGDNDTYAWTLGNSITYPKVTNLATGNLSLTASTSYTRSKAYYAEHYLGPHIGCRFYHSIGTATSGEIDLSYAFGTGTRVHDGLSVIPSRQYQLIWNRLFRNENIQNPVLFSKSSTYGSLDYQYKDGLGKLLKANRLKDFINQARLGPSIQTVDIGLGNLQPVYGTSANHSIPSNGGALHFINQAGTQHANGALVIDSGYSFSTTQSVSGDDVVRVNNLWADLSGLTVNSLYYAIMKQKFLDKMSNGRRPVEFYANMFGVMQSNAAFDDPELLSQKRFKINITRVVATANSEDSQQNAVPLGTQGAFSVTSAGGTLFPEFTATEYGGFWVFAVIRTQESYSSGIDRHLTEGQLLDTYLPVFDHIGEDYVELSELCNAPLTNANKVFGYQRAWYSYRYHVNHTLGILSPGEPMDYWSFARDFDYNLSPFTINSNFIEQGAGEFDRMLQFPVFYGTPNGTDEDGGHIDAYGEPLNSNRYQWLIQFCLAGDFARTMSADSDPIMFGQRI